MGELKRVTTNDALAGRAREIAGIALPDGTMLSMLEGLATVHAIVVAVDSRLRVTWISDALDIIPGGAHKSVGTTVSGLLDGLWPEDIAAFGEQTQNFFDEMTASNRVTRARFDFRHDGRPLPLEVSGFHTRDAFGNDLVVCVADRYQTLEALEEKNEELRSYARSVSHDLRSPLVSLLGFSRLLRDDYGAVLDEIGLHFLDRIEQAGRHMEQLLNDMLELSRIGATPHCRVDVNPRLILEELQSQLKLQLDEKNIRLILPEDPPTLFCDRTRLYRLLSNLIGNAIHYNHRKQLGETGYIGVEIASQGDGWQIAVHDNGPGIPREDHERIFEVFQTAGDAAAGQKSSGLGLAIVKKIVEAHSGRVWVDSEPGSGTTFFVWLPTG